MMKNIIPIILVVLLFTGCSERIHTHVKIQKDDIRVMDYEGLVQDFQDHGIGYEEKYYDKNATYIVLRQFADHKMSIVFFLQLSCDTKSTMKFYDPWTEYRDNSGLEYLTIANYTKQSLIDAGCLQEGTQTIDITAKIDSFAEYTTDKVTHTEHTVSSNTITFTAQEINEAIAVFESK